MRRHDERLGFFRRGDDLVGFLQIDRQRLFAEHILSACSALIAYLGVQIRRQADVDGVDVGIGDKFLGRLSMP